MRDNSKVDDSVDEKGAVDTSKEDIKVDLPLSKKLLQCPQMMPFRSVLQKSSQS